MRHRLRLHGGVDRHPPQVLGRQRAGGVRHREALLKQRRQPFLAQPLPPAGQRRALERQIVAERVLAAEELKIRVLQPAAAQRLVRQRMHVLQDQQAGDQPNRQRRLTRTRPAHRAEPLVEKPPVDPLRQPYQRVAQVDDLLQRRPKQILLPLVARPRHRPSRSPKQPPERITDTPKRESQIARKPASFPAFWQK
jgi:hypothetical protein